MHHPHHAKIISLLEEHFVFCGRGELARIYDEVLALTSTAHPSDRLQKKMRLPFARVEDLHPVFFKVIQSIRETAVPLSFATDLPVFVESYKKDAPTVMVCAMDSLPPVPRKDNRNQHLLHPHQNPELDLCQHLSFWAPFSLVEDLGDANARFFEGLLPHYNVYVTDLYKLFFYIDQNQRDKRGNPIYRKSNGWSDYRILDAHREMLWKEMHIVDPACIITLGNNAGNALLSFVGEALEPWGKGKHPGKLQQNRASGVGESKKDVPIISMPHISGAANGARKLILDCPDYRHVPGVHMEKYVNILLEELGRFS